MKMPMYHRRQLPTVLCGFLLATGVAICAAEPPEAAATKTSWPMYRGGRALLGTSPATLPDKLTMLWSFKTTGTNAAAPKVSPVKSSAAIVDGKVYFGADDGLLYAIDLAKGQKLWHLLTGGPIESSPLVIGGKVFVGSSDGFLYAADAKTGKELWKYKTEDKILGAPNWVHSPDGKKLWILVGSYDFKLHCVEADTGKKVWEYESGN